MTRKYLLQLARQRERKPWRGKDIKKKLPIPWTTREVVFTCSNGWTIEKIDPRDNFIEGVLMGHCMGVGVGRYCGTDGLSYSLRDEHGIPHVTIDIGKAHGRCNQRPPEKYLDLVREWKPEMRVMAGYGNDTDTAYHEEGKLSDVDYRDIDTTEGRYWRRSSWMEKRGAVG